MSCWPPPAYGRCRCRWTRTAPWSDGLGRERAVLLTPAHQFPTGGPLHPVRRAAVVDWARARGGLILEDDYDGEFRYDRKPVGAVQGLDPERVCTSARSARACRRRCGWAGWCCRSGTSTPCSRRRASGRRGRACRSSWRSRTSSSPGRTTVMCGGCGSGTGARRDRLVAALAAHAPHVEVTGDRGRAARRAAAAARDRAVGGEGGGLAGCRARRAGGVPASRGDGGRPPDGLVVGYATPPEHAYGAALEALCGVLPPG